MLKHLTTIMAAIALIGTVILATITFGTDSTNDAAAEQYEYAGSAEIIKKVTDCQKMSSNSYTQEKIAEVELDEYRAQHPERYQWNLPKDENHPYWDALDRVDDLRQSMRRVGC